MKSIININLVKSIFITLGLITMSAIWTESEATHIVGGQLTYKHLGGNSYQVKLTLRRDCYLGSPEAEFDNPASIGVFTAAGDLAKWLPGLKEGQLFLPFMASDTLNEYIKSDCGFEGTQVCVHETTYQGVVNLPKRLGGYILAYQRCCRNGSINNIIDPLETGSTYWVAISDKAYDFKNSSPEFHNWPDVYICADKPLVFDHSANDTDGDSLVYRLCVPNSGASRNFPKPQPPNYPPFPLVDFAPPYSLNDVMGGIPLTIDPKTGLMTATPNLVGQFLVGVCVEEYRNGELIGIVRRDFQFNVRVCSQPPLALFTTSESNCDGLTVKFFNNSLASNSFIWDFNYPDQDTLFRSTEANPIFTFPKSGVYKVQLKAIRGSDLCMDTLIQTVSVFENTITPDFNYLLNGCDSDMDSLEILLTDQSVFNEPGYNLESWNWKITQNGVEKLLSGSTTKFKVSSNADFTIELVVSAENGCLSTLQKHVNIHDLVPKLDFNVRLNSCIDEEEIELVLENISQSLNPLAILEKSEWTVLGQTYTGNPLIIRVPVNNDDIEIKLLSTFRDACDVSLTKIFRFSDLLPFADVAMSYEGCPDDGNVTIKLTYIDTLSKGINALDLDWKAGIASNIQAFSGNSITLVIPKDSVLYYTLNVAFANGCTDTVNADTIPGPFATLAFSESPIVLCPGETKSILTNANPDWTYVWSPTTGLDLSDPNDPKVIADENRTYYVTVSDGLCTVTDSIEVLILAGGIDLFITGDTITCDKEIQLTANGGVGTGKYSWSTNPNINPVIATGETVVLPVDGRSKTYYVSFVGDACSTEPAAITVHNEKPAIDNLSPFKFCKEDTSKILILNLINTHQNNYIWDTDSHIVGGTNTSEPIIGIGAGETGSITLYYNVSNQFGCQLRDSVIINIGENPVVDFSFDLTECGSYQVCFDASGTYDGFLFWEFGDPTTSDDKSLDKSPCYTYPDAGIYQVILNNKVNVCPFKDVVKEIKINPLLTLNSLGDHTACLGDSILLTATSNLNDVQYQWYDKDNNLFANGNSIKVVVKDDTKYIIKAIDDNGCEDTDTVSVNLFRFVFDIRTESGDSLCENQPGFINLNVADPNDYIIEWYPSNVIVSGQNTVRPEVSLSHNGTIGVKLTHKLTGCVDSSAVNVNIAKPFDFDVAVPELVCYDEISTLYLDIDNPGNYDYYWEPKNVFINGLGTTSPEIRIKDSLLVSVEVVSKTNGCKKSLQIPLDVSNPIIIDVQAVPSVTINEGETAELKIVDVIAGISYVWSTGENGTFIIVSPTETTTYYVTGTDKDGCSGVDTVTVTVRKAKCDETDVYIPNAFTPNGDNNNDIFIPRSHFIDEMELVIYNRWGQEMFRSTDKNTGWDGTFKGKPMPPDAYAYYLKVICVNVEEYQKRGNVTLIR